MGGGWNAQDLFRMSAILNLERERKKNSIYLEEKKERRQ